MSTIFSVVPGLTRDRWPHQSELADMMPAIPGQARDDEGDEWA